MTTSVSPYRSGEPRFGRRDHQPFDKSVKETRLTPEELELYLAGKLKIEEVQEFRKRKEEGIVEEEKMVLTPEKYHQHKTADELSDSQIRKLYSMNGAVFQKFKQENDLVGKYRTSREISKTSILPGSYKPLPKEKPAAQPIPKVVENKEQELITEISRLKEEVAALRGQISEHKATAEDLSRAFDDANREMVIMKHYKKDYFFQVQRAEAYSKTILKLVKELKQVGKTELDPVTEALYLTIPQ